MVPVPPCAPCHSVRGSPGPVIRTLGSGGTSSSRVTGSPNASPTLASVARFGFERACSRETRTPLLTPDRAASWSSDQPRSARRAARVRASAALRSLPGTGPPGRKRLAVGLPNGMDFYSDRNPGGCGVVVIMSALPAAVLYGSADFLGGAASRQTRALSVASLSVPAGALVMLAAAAVAGG